MCGGDGATCRLVRGHYRSQTDSGWSKNPPGPARHGPESACLPQPGHPGVCLLRPGKDTVVVVPYRSRHVRLVLKGPGHLCESRSRSSRWVLGLTNPPVPPSPRPPVAHPTDVESKTLQGVLAQLDPQRSGLHLLENTTLDFQKLPDKETLRTAGPLGADFSVKVRAWGGVQADAHFLSLSSSLQVRLGGGADSTVQYIFYQPIGHRWRETDFFPCSVTCGGGEAGAAGGPGVKGRSPLLSL